MCIKMKIKFTNRIKYQSSTTEKSRKYDFYFIYVWYVLIRSLSGLSCLSVVRWCFIFPFVGSDEKSIETEVEHWKHVEKDKREKRDERKKEGQVKLKSDRNENDDDDHSSLWLMRFNWSSIQFINVTRSLLTLHTLLLSSDQWTRPDRGGLHTKYFITLLSYWNKRSNNILFLHENEKHTQK